MNDFSTVPRSTAIDACDTPELYNSRAAAYKGYGPVPTLLENRKDLLPAIAASAVLYTTDVRAQRRRIVALFADEDEPGMLGVRKLLEQLVAGIVGSVEEYRSEYRSSETALVVVGTYEHVSYQLLTVAIEAARESGQTAWLLTGRDVASLSWMVAKQFFTRNVNITAKALYSGANHLNIATSQTTVVDSKNVDNSENVRPLTTEIWHQVVLHGHGTEDSINLGEATICGLNASVALRDSSALRPKCGYGLGCYKPDDKVISLTAIVAQSIVLASCCNAVFRPNGFYDPKYLLLLNGIDGTAQQIIAAPMVHDLDSAELVRWAGEFDEGKVVSSPPLLEDIHPFQAFVAVGLPLPIPEVFDVEAVLPDPRRAADVSARSLWLLADGIRSGSTGVVKSLTSLRRKIENGTARSTRGNPQRWARLESDILADIQSIDLRLAQHIAKDPEDPVLDFPQYFGDRSKIDRDTIQRVRCMCGLEATEWVRSPIFAYHPPTQAMVCPRCGDVRFSTPGAPIVELHVPERQVVGQPLRGRVVLRAEHQRLVYLVIFTPRYMRGAYRTLEPRRIRLAQGGTETLDFTMDCVGPVTPQAYYLTAFVVADLSLVTVRQRFGLYPDESGAS